MRRAAALWACRSDAARSDELLAVVKDFECHTVLKHGRLARATTARLVGLEDEYERQLLAQNPSLPPDLVERLASDPEHDVRRQVSARPGLTEAQRAAIDHRIDSKDRLGTLDWFLDLTGDSAALRACATSAHPWLRRSAARHPALPADLVGLLAGDEDFAVRLLICESHPGVPPEALLRMVLEWDGYSSYNRLRMPQFPRKGLARYADRPDVLRRRLAVHDPDASPELIDRLSRDEHVWV
ncbi:hypothetical protein [Streptomyces adelaidensis]|uniref:hypothetical protein n=1 Tax=Streptomyces adelaidensis TaxID=2796465 RepID=UPI0019078DA2|nr:hypothetical protein [Streptomyces adelaidensis]